MLIIFLPNLCYFWLDQVTLHFLVQNLTVNVIFVKAWLLPLSPSLSLPLLPTSSSLFRCHSCVLDGSISTGMRPPFNHLLPRFQDHNRQLEAQLQRLRQLLLDQPSPNPDMSSSSASGFGTLQSKSVVAADLHVHEHSQKGSLLTRCHFRSKFLDSF